MLVLPCFARPAGSLRLAISASLWFRHVHVVAPVAIGRLRCTPAIGGGPSVSLRAPRYGDLEAELGGGVSGIGRFTAGGHRSTGMGGSRLFLSRSLRFVSRKLALVAGWPRHRPLRPRWLADRVSVRGFVWTPRCGPRLLRGCNPFGVNPGSGPEAAVRGPAGGVPEWDCLLRCAWGSDSALEDAWTDFGEGVR